MYKVYIDGQVGTTGLQLRQKLQNHKEVEILLISEELRKDENERKMIDKVLSLNIFKGVKNDNVLHEYDFYDEQNNVHGIIDCILVKDDEVDIIDFKLKNINDEEYIKQLKIYKNYVKTITKKPIKTYLLSISLGMLRKIHDEVC